MLVWYLISHNTTKGVEWCYGWPTKPKSFLNVISVPYSVPMWSLLLLCRLLVNDYKLKVWNWTWKSCQNKRVGLYLTIDWKWGWTKIPSFQAQTRVHLHWNVGLPNLQANATCGLPFNVDLNLTNYILIDLNTILPLVTITILSREYTYNIQWMGPFTVGVLLLGV